MVLLEREQSLATLARALESAVGGNGRVALVSGEAGVGKTSLTEAFVEAHRTEAAVLWGACDALFTPRPLGPLHDIAPQVGGELGRQLDSDTPRHALFSTFLRELQQSPTPFIVVFEDVHWADEATLDLIKFLARRIQRTRALFILTYREDEVGAQHPLCGVIGDLPHAATVRMPLMPLSRAGVAALARAAGRADRAEDLYTATVGNAFFVTEALANPGAILPTTIRDAVLARASRLPPAARAVLDLPSVSPSAIESWLPEACLNCNAAALDECVSRGMLRTGGTLYAFRHELARRAIEEALAQQRSSLNRKVLEALRAAGARSRNAGASGASCRGRA